MTSTPTSHDLLEAAFHAETRIFSLCPNLEAINVDVLKGVEGSDWAFAIAKLPRLRSMAIDFSYEGEANLQTIRILSMSAAIQMTLLGIETVSDSGDLPMEAHLYSLALLATLPRERTLIFRAFAEITAGDTGRLLHSLGLEDNNFTFSIDFDERIGDAICNPEVCLLDWLDKHRPKIRKLRLHHSWDMVEESIYRPASITALAKVCDQLGELEIDGADLILETEGQFPAELKKLVLKGCSTPHIDMMVEVVRDGRLQKLEWIEMTVHGANRIVSLKTLEVSLPPPVPLRM